MIGSVRAGMAAAAAAAAVACAAVPTTQAAVTLTFATVDSPYADVNIHIHHPWAERVSAARGGFLHIRVVDGPRGADFADVYKRVLDDEVQIGWALQPYMSVPFPLSEVAALPLVASSAEDASVALYRLWKSGALDSEYRDIEPLKLCTTSEAGVHLREVPKSNDGFKGLRIIEAGRIGADTITALGGRPVTLQLAAYRKTLVDGGADGVLAGWPLLEPLGLHAVTKFHVEVALGGTPCMVFMAKKRYLALPADARHVLDARTREHETRMLGLYWDKAAQEGRYATGGRKGHMIVAPAKDQMASFKRRVQPAVEAWVRRTPGGAAVLAKFRAALAEIAAGR